jgi:predicted phosphodiesterase
MKRIVFVKLVCCLAVLWACDTPFSYSPFEARLDDELQGLTKKNLLRIAQADSAYDSVFSIALLSDVHYHFNNLADALADINRRTDVAFIIVNGDITENGLQKEFELFHNLMLRANRPYLTVIGNHDHLSNGAAVYEQMFGSRNYHFIFNDIKFVMWDNVRWESNATPDWNWFRHELAPASQPEGRAVQDRTIPFSHIPPFDGQLLDSAQAFHQVLRSSAVEVSIHGHKHEYFAGELFGDGIEYVTIGSPQHRTYALLTITPRDVTVTKVNY